MEKKHEKQLFKVLNAMNEAGPLASSSAMVLYSDLGTEETNAVLAAAAKIISEHSETENSLKAFGELVEKFKKEG